MVAIHSHPRRPSAGGSLGRTAGKAKRKSSLRRQSEKVTPTASTSTTRHAANQKRSKSVSAGVPSTQQQQQNRRPSAPAAVMDEIPRLSIADQFMATGYSPVLSQTLPLSTPTAATQKSLLSVSTTLSNSTSSDIPITGNNNGLSVADRFMNTNSSNSNNVSSSSTNSMQSVQQYRERPRSSFSGRSFNNTKPTSTTDPVPGRLTIASSFMKSSNTLTPYSATTPDTTTRSRTASFADELDLGATSGISGRKPSQGMHIIYAK